MHADKQQSILFVYDIRTEQIKYHNDTDTIHTELSILRLSHEIQKQSRRKKNINDQFHRQYHCLFTDKGLSFIMVGYIDLLGICRICLILFYLKKADDGNEKKGTAQSCPERI
jgi:hypothetical protein